MPLPKDAFTSIFNPAFDQQKAALQFDTCDRSRKGEIDAPIASIVARINQSSNFFTTSSCSGRVLVFSHTSTSSSAKEGCLWHFVSHASLASADIELLGAALSIDSERTLKFEGMILHVQCRTLEDGRRLHEAVAGAGFRNSGLTVGKAGRVQLAVRTSLCLEMPVMLLRGEEVVRLADVVNRKFEVNEALIKKFESVLDSALIDAMG